MIMNDVEKEVEKEVEGEAIPPSRNGHCDEERDTLDEERHRPRSASRALIQDFGPIWYVRSIVFF